MMNRTELLKYCGSVEQDAGVRPVTYTDGRANGMRCILVQNGPMEYTLMQDKCLDLMSLRYRGINIGILTKPGLQGRNPYDTHGVEALRSLMGGAMFTCGFESIHTNRTVDGVEYPLHGRMRTTPMEKICMDACFQGSDYVLSVSGEGREAVLFGENTVLRRSVRSVYGTSKILIRDEITNEAFRPEPLCFLYHVNCGYPFLREGCRFLLPEHTCSCADAHARQQLEHRLSVQAPVDNVPECVYLYTPKADAAGNTLAAVVNDRLELALCIRWNIRQIPYLTQWKSMASGDYAVALEPCNVGFDGREDPGVEVLQPLQTHLNEWSIELVEGAEGIAALENELAGLSGA